MYKYQLLYCTQVGEEALARIEDKGYAKPSADDPVKAIKRGVSFSLADRRIGVWKVVR